MPLPPFGSFWDIKCVKQGYKIVTISFGLLRISRFAQELRNRSDLRHLTFTNVFLTTFSHFFIFNYEVDERRKKKGKPS